MKDLDPALAPQLDRYAAAVWALDAPALMQLYDPEVRVFDTWGLWCHQGAEAWQRAVEGWFRSVGSERVRVRFQDTRTTPGADVAGLSTLVCYAAMSPQGEELRTMHNRLTWLLRRRGHGWRIVHEHTSAPVGFEDGKAILSYGG